MKIKGKFLIPIFVMVFFAGLVIAAIPPPPVNQNFGIYDTTMINYNETLCRGCHNSTFEGGVPTRHSNLVTHSITNPATNLPFVCTDCHPHTPGVGSGELIDRNCMDCHNGTAFWGNSLGAHVSNFTRPHHNTTYAQARNCKFCHGASVDDYNDGHYVPSYPPSEVTPSVYYKVSNLTSMRVWGGCLACHDENTLATPPIYFEHTIGFPPLPTGTNNVHHDEILGTTGGTSKGDQCLWCHVDVTDVLNIRGCETCHSVRSIHNIQYDFNDTSTLPGYGHIGSNNPSDPANDSWDCRGCHAWYDAGDVAPLAGAIVPDVKLVTPSVIAVGTPTTLNISGANFVNAPYTSVVTVDGVEYTPISITDSHVMVDIPALDAGVHMLQVLKGGDTPSNLNTLTVVPVATLSSANLNGTDLILSGFGFGSKPAANAEQYVTFSNAAIVSHSEIISSWSDTKIIATITGSVAAGDTVEVITANGGEARATIVASNVTIPILIPLATPIPAPVAIHTPIPVATQIVKPVLKLITVSPSATTVSYNGGTQTFTATAKDQNGNPMKGISISWSSSAANIGTVSPTSATTDSNGQVTTKFIAKRQRGKITVTAKSGSVSINAMVIVQ